MWQEGLQLAVAEKFVQQGMQPVGLIQHQCYQMKGSFCLQCLKLTAVDQLWKQCLAGVLGPQKLP